MVTKYKIVKLLSRETYVLIQTDKGQYKAKDTAKFRVLALDHNLRPSPVEVVDELWIDDPRGRRVQQWLDVHLQKGLVQKEVELGPEPEIGTWTISWETNTVSGQLKEKVTFQVSEYVLPKFEVEIRSPPAVLRNAEQIEWVVCARYTHGGVVKGSVKANFSSGQYEFWPGRPVPFSHPIQPVQDVPKFLLIEKEVADGQECATIVLERIQILDLTQYRRIFKLEVAFEEHGTGTVEKAETSSSVEDQEILLEPRMESSWPYMGLPYIGELLVKNHDGSRVGKEVIELCVELNDIEVCHYLISDEAGSIKFHVPLPIRSKRGARDLKITAKAVNRPSDSLKGMRQPERAERVFLHSDERERNTMEVGLLGEEKQDLLCERMFKAKVFIASTVWKTINIHYDIISKGAIVISDQMEVEVGHEDVLEELVRGTKEFVFEEIGDESWKISSAEIPIFVDHRVSPQMDLVVFVVDRDTNITVMDSHSYKVEGCQEHRVSTSWDQEKVSPGSHVTLSVTAKEGSLCALSATDKSINLLGNKNSITVEGIEDLRRQIGLRKINPTSLYALQGKCPYFLHALRQFEGTGLTIVCEIPGLCECKGIIKDDKRERKDKDEDYDLEPLVFGASDGLALEPEFSLRSPTPQIAPSPIELASTRNSLEAPKVSLRSFFPETWLFTLDSISDDADIEKKLTVPDTFTTWNAEAFCINSEVRIQLPIHLCVRHTKNYSIRHLDTKFNLCLL